VIPAGFQSEDAQDDSQGKERVGAGDCAKNAGLGVAFWETISIKPETGSTQQGEQEANDSSQKPRSILPAGAGIDGAVQVLGDRLGRNNRAKAAVLATSSIRERTPPIKRPSGSRGEALRAQA
jgi:hypothetical protein